MPDTRLCNTRTAAPSRNAARPVASAAPLSHRGAGNGGLRLAAASVDLALFYCRERRADRPRLAVDRGSRAGPNFVGGRRTAFRLAPPCLARRATAAAGTLSISPRHARAAAIALRLPFRYLGEAY